MNLRMTNAISISRLGVALAIWMLAAPAGAQTQTQGTETTPPTPVATTGQSPTSPIAPARPREIAQPYWTNNAGFETDTHNTGYGFFGPQYVRPFRPNVSWLAGANVNYLYYEYATGNGITHVGAPGVNVKGGVKLGEKNSLQLTAGPSFKRRFIDVKDAAGNVIGSSRDVRTGISLGVDGSVDPTSHSNLYGIYDFNSSDNYNWSRLAYKEQISNRNWGGPFAHFVGAEVIGQGNQDIHSTQVGAFFETAYVPAHMSIMLRGGWKRSTFAVGPDKTGPWVAIGFWQRLR